MSTNIPVPKELITKVELFIMTLGPTEPPSEII